MVFLVLELLGAHDTMALLHWFAFITGFKMDKRVKARPQTLVVKPVQSGLA